MSNLPSSLPPSLRSVRALVFDLFGTSLDWYTPLTSTLNSSYPDISSDEWSTFAFAWRTAFLAHTATEGKRGSFRPTAELYSDALNDVIMSAIGKAAEVASKWTKEERQGVSKAWSQMIPFEDTVAGVDLLKEKLVVGLSNGSAAALVPMCKSAELKFDLLLTSDLIGTYKPARKMYQTALSALDLKPEEVAMVAAHEWDLGAAQEVGMKAIYIERWTEDREVNRDALRDRFDLYINEGGVVELARRFGAVP